MGEHVGAARGQAAGIDSTLVINTGCIKFSIRGSFPVLTVDDCQRRADECARLAEAATSEHSAARYRRLEICWLYLFRLKARKKYPYPNAATN
jgi:hypothetical protein